ncbi:MAG TPA: NADH-quinone oxidoreductase subunit NuoH [Symbiobacteriaceae bacterium]|nr:NADH-quinone oxidoreductase subunit NuoH [Symbiobacteriaceae bacterium]
MAVFLSSSPWIALAWVTVKALLVAGAILTGAALYLTALRKTLGYFTYRLGPTRVGPWGLFQVIADAVKMMIKEDILPEKADKAVFRLAPIIFMFTAVSAMAIIPWGPSDSVFASYVADPNAGILVFLALGAISVYGVALGGWASQNKYSLMGSLRSTAQMISYELAMGMAVIGIIIATGSTRLTDIVNAQHAWPFIAPQILGFIVYYISALAETSHVPFDLPEAESELVGGYFTEYAGMRFGLYFLGELVAQLVQACLISLLFLGGWNVPFFLAWIPGIAVIPATLWFVLKVCFVIFTFLWIRATMPRMRYDRLMSFGWKFLLPVSALNLIIQAVWVALF